MSNFRIRILLILCFSTTAITLPVASVCANSTNLYGTLGLNTIPSARHDQAGTIRAHLAASDPYMHATLGAQLTDSLWMGLRQSAELSGLNDKADRLYPGLDLKIRLLEESAYRPEISLGLQSAFGHKRTAGEYLALSKRYENLDFTAGIGWGRYGSAKHAGNPMNRLFSHFSEKRSLDGEDPNTPDDWFKGPIGFFAGIEYDTPLDGLSLKADFSADSYDVEKKSISGFERPAPWSVSANYAATPWTDFSIGLQGTDTVMGRISLQGFLGAWPFGKSAKQENIALRPARTSELAPAQMKNDAEKYGYILTTPVIDVQSAQAQARLKLSPYQTTALQIGQVARPIANHGGPGIETLSIQPSYYGLKGPLVSIQRRDLELLGIRHQSSGEEIWHNAELTTKMGEMNTDQAPMPREFTMALDQQFSLSEEDKGLLYRTGIVLDLKEPLFEKAFYGLSLRGTLKHNLTRLNQFRPRSTNPVRSDVDVFAQRGLSIDRSYYQFLHSFTPEWHAGLSAGYLEEMYGGAGGELLYRPFGSTWAFGVDAYSVAKRDPYSLMALGFATTPGLTAHATAYYEFPNQDLTASFSAGRYLAGDWGGTLALQNRFKNGAQLKAYATATTKSDRDIFGDETSLVTGFNLSVPIGSIKYVPDGSEIRLSSMPFGRDGGQKLDAPVKLYDATEPLSYRHITQNWTDIAGD